jgi:hypothetical protein
MTVERKQESAPARRLLLVVGVGRSGTSLIASILSRLGFHVPQPEVQADESNPRGFGEPRWVVDFHTRLMRRRRVTVLDARPAAWERTAGAADDEEVFKELRSWLAVQFVGAGDVLVKDPRSGWFLPLWLRAATDLGVQPSFVTMLRHPLEVVSSARTWYGTWQKDASRAAAWVNVTLQTELATRAAARAFVRYDDLVEDWSREISRVARLLDVGWLTAAELSQRPDVDALVDPGLRRSTQARADVSLPSSLETLLEDVWGRISRLADVEGEDAATRSSLDDARAAYVQLYAEAEAIAQSSVTAAKPRRKRSAAPAPGAARSDQAPQSHAPLVLRMARRIPPRYRRRLPLRLRRAVRSLRGSPL